MNPGVATAMVHALGDVARRGVVEIGPGHGVLTKLLLEKGARVVAVEIDPALADELEDALGSRPGFAMLRGDALELDWPAVVEAALAGVAQPVRLCASLPYESGTRILLDWLGCSAADARMPEAVVMLQKEVGERLLARPRTKEYGSLAVLAQSTHSVRSVMDVAPGSFRPAPKVWSKVLHLTRLDAPLFLPPERERQSAFAHAAFAHRRKQLASDLAGRAELSREQWQERLVAIGHPPTARAEELTPAEIVTLARS